MDFSALAQLGAGIINTAGSIYANQQNIANQSAMNQANIAAQMAINDANLQATALNNQTAVNLANTAHQREVRDLRDAGLNPILSANGNGASVPQLDSPNLEAPMSQAATVNNPLGGIASALTALQARSDQHEIDKLRQQILSGSIPRGDSLSSGVDLLRAQSRAETNSAISQARKEEAAADFETEILRQKLSFLRSGLVAGHSGGVSVMQPLKRTRENYMELIRDALESDLKDVGNRNWRNNVNAVGNMVNTAGTLSDIIRPRPKIYR